MALSPSPFIIRGGKILDNRSSGGQAKPKKLRILGGGSILRIGEYA